MIILTVIWTKRNLNLEGFGEVVYNVMVFFEVFFVFFFSLFKSVNVACLRGNLRNF